jgi:hypothetical protein
VLFTLLAHNTAVIAHRNSVDRPGPKAGKAQVLILPASCATRKLAGRKATIQELPEHTMGRSRSEQM